jgi:hypothetical protein
LKIYRKIEGWQRGPCKVESLLKIKKKGNVMSFDFTDNERKNPQRSFDGPSAYWLAMFSLGEERSKIVILSGAGSSYPYTGRKFCSDL